MRELREAPFHTFVHDSVDTMDSVNKREYKLRDLGTKSVTLFPTRAQVVREIKDIPLVVSRLTPTPLLQQC